MSKTLHIKQGKIVGIRTSVFTIFNPEKYDPMAIPTAWKEFFTKAADSELSKNDTFYGASIPSMSMDAPMDYFAGALVESEFETPDGFESVDILEGEYVTFEHVGPISEIASSYQKAYMQFLPASGREMRPAPHLEIYDPKLDPMDAEYRMLIGVPVK
jgi:predicted transcriptional regulator YdeE